MYGEEHRLGLEPDALVSAESTVITENLVTMGNCKSLERLFGSNSRHDSVTFVQGSNISCLLHPTGVVYFPDL